MTSWLLSILISCLNLLFKHEEVKRRWMLMIFRRCQGREAGVTYAKYTSWLLPPMCTLFLGGKLGIFGRGWNNSYDTEGALIKFRSMSVCLVMPHFFRPDGWTVAGQAPLSMRFPRQEYCSGLPFPSLGYLPNPGIEPMSLASAGRFFTTALFGKPPSEA